MRNDSNEGSDVIVAIQTFDQPNLTRIPSRRPSARRQDGIGRTVTSTFLGALAITMMRLISSSPIVIVMTRYTAAAWVPSLSRTSSSMLSSSTSTASALSLSLLSSSDGGGGGGGGWGMNVRNRRSFTSSSMTLSSSSSYSYSSPFYLSASSSFSSSSSSMSSTSSTRLFQHAAGTLDEEQEEEDDAYHGDEVQRQNQDQDGPKTGRIMNVTGRGGGGDGTNHKKEIPPSQALTNNTSTNRRTVRITAREIYDDDFGDWDGKRPWDDGSDSSRPRQRRGGGSNGTTSEGWEWDEHHQSSSSSSSSTRRRRNETSNNNSPFPFPTTTTTTTTTGTTTDTTATASLSDNVTPVFNSLSSSFRTNDNDDVIGSQRPRRPQIQVAPTPPQQSQSQQLPEIQPNQDDRQQSAPAWSSSSSSASTTLSSSSPFPSSTGIGFKEEIHNDEADDDDCPSPHSSPIDSDADTLPWSDSSVLADERRNQITGPPIVGDASLVMFDLSNDAAATTTTISTDNVVVVPSISSDGLDDAVDSLQFELARLEDEIYTMNGGTGGSNNNNDDNNALVSSNRYRGMKFNINSPKQVSEVLFGQPDMATNKDVLEAMASSNILAKLILQYRDTKKRLGKATTLVQRRDRRRGDEGNKDDDSAGGGSTSTQKTRPANGTTIGSPTSSYPDLVDPILLMDTSSFIFRAYYSMPPMHRGDDGMPVGAVLGFCNMLNRLVLDKLLRGEQPRLVLCCDAPTTEDSKTFRHDLYDEYKSHRPALPVDLIPQFGLIQRAAQAYGLVQVQAVGYEADDVLATLSTWASKRECHPVRILSGDKDLMQLITAGHHAGNDNQNDDDDNDGGRPAAPIEMVDPMTSTTWRHETVVEKWGVGPSQLGDVLALAGDAADNVPGVPGIGPKIAAQLIRDYGTLQTLLDNTATVKQKGRREKLDTYRDQALLSRELVELRRDLEWGDMQVLYPHGQEFAPVMMAADVNDDDDDNNNYPAPPTASVTDLRMEPMNANRILQFYDDMGFHTIKQRLLERLSQQTLIRYGVDAEAQSASSLSVEAITDTDPPQSSNDASITIKPKRNWTAKKKMGIPQPEDYMDVPF